MGRLVSVILSKLFLWSVVVTHHRWQRHRHWAKLRKYCLTWLLLLSPSAQWVYDDYGRHYAGQMWPHKYSNSLFIFLRYKTSSILVLNHRFGESVHWHHIIFAFWSASNDFPLWTTTMPTTLILGQLSQVVLWEAIQLLQFSLVGAQHADSSAFNPLEVDYHNIPRPPASPGQH